MSCSMIERVARAIAPGAWGLLDLFDGDHSKLDVWPNGEISVSLIRARAAIKAMREPTDAMVRAGDACDEMRDEFTATPRHAAECEVHWAAMIDAALRDSGRPPEGENPERSGGVEGEAGQSGDAESGASPKLSQGNHNHA